MKNVEKQPRLTVLTRTSLSCKAIGRNAGRPGKAGKLLMISDFSDESINAERRAAMLSCELGDTPLEVMAVVNSDSGAVRRHSLTVISEEDLPQVRDIELGLRDASSRLREWQGLDYVCSIRFGNPVAAIVERADEVEAVLLVVASYKSTLAESLSRGYGTNDVIRAIERPALVVNRVSQRAYMKIVIAVDVTEPLPHVASTAIRLAGDAHYHFLFVIDDNKAMLNLGDREPNETRLLRRMREDRMMQANLTGFINALGLKQERVQSVVRRGHPSSAVCAYANEIGADLIVCGKRASRYSGNGIIGSVATELLVQTACDLLVVPPATGESRYSDRPAA